MLLILLSSCGLTACGVDNAANTITAQTDEPHIMLVKEGHPISYPETTYGEAFENFFGAPAWEYFEGSNDDSDETYDVVEFTGNCMYHDVEVTAKLQFTLDMEDGSFEAAYLSFNDVPQTNFMLLALIDAAFTNGSIEDEPDGTSSSDNLPSAEPENVTEAAPSPDALYLGDYEMLSEYENSGASLSLTYSTDDGTVYLEGFANYEGHSGEAYGEVHVIDDCHFYMEDSGNRLDMIYDSEKQTLTVEETGTFGGVGVTFAGVYGRKSNTADAAVSQNQLDSSEIDALLAEIIPPFVAVASSDVSITWESDTAAMIVVNIQSAIPDAFSAKGPVVIDASVLPGTGEWAVHTFSFDQGFEITYNYAGTYAENDRKVRFCDIESEVQVGAGCAMLTVMPIDETAGGSDPTGDTHTAYLDYCTENGPDDAVYVLETSYGDIRIFMDADMKPIAVSLPQDIWSIP